MTDTPGRPGSDRGPARPPDVVLRELEEERARLIDAIDNLKLEAQATRDRIRSFRKPVIAGGLALVTLMILLRSRSRRRACE